MKAKGDLTMRTNIQKTIFAVLFLALFAGCATVDDYWYDGNNAAKNGDYEKAIAQYTKAIEASEKRWDLMNSYKLRGDLFAKMGLHNEAIADYSEIIRIGFNDFLLERGKIYLEIKDYEKALNDFNQFISLESSNPIGYSLRGNVSIAIDDYDSALNDYNTAMEKFNDIIRRDPVMTILSYEQWLEIVKNYISYFNKKPDMLGHAKLIIGSQQIGNIEITRFDNAYVSLYNCVLSVPAGRHSITIKYNYRYTTTSTRIGVVTETTPLEGSTGSSTLIGPGQITETSGYELTSTIPTDHNFVSGRLYKIILSEYNSDYFPKRLSFADISGDEGIE